MFYCKIDETPDSLLCIGGYSALPAAKLLSLGIMQAGFPFALAESQFCLWSLSCLFSFIAFVGMCKIAHMIYKIQKYRKIVFLQRANPVVAFLEELYCWSVLGKTCQHGSVDCCMSRAE